MTTAILCIRTAVGAWLIGLGARVMPDAPIPPDRWDAMAARLAAAVAGEGRERGGAT